MTDNSNLLMQIALYNMYNIKYKHDKCNMGIALVNMHVIKNNSDDAYTASLALLDCHFKNYKNDFNHLNDDQKKILRNVQNDLSAYQNLQDHIKNL
jgi:hypothetical protein